MFEAVGREYWPGFFAKLNALLKPGGRACIQSITIRDDLFERYVDSTDFIQQYIFPGGLLPSPTRVPRAGRTRRAAHRQRAALRRRLCRDAAPLARALPGAGSRRAPAGLRRPLHAHLGVLPGLLRSRRSPPATPTSCSSRWKRHDVAHAAAAPPCAAAAGRAAGRCAGQPRAAALPPELKAELPARGCWAKASCSTSACTSTTSGCGARPSSAAAIRRSQPLALELEYARALDGKAIAERSLQGDAGPGRDRRGAGRALAAADAPHLPRREQGRPHHRRAAPGRGGALLRQRPAARRGARRRVHAAVLRHLAVAAHLAAQAARSAARHAGRARS